MDDGFDRGGDPSLRRRALLELADRLGLATIGDLQSALDDHISQARSGGLKDSQLEALDDATNLIQKLEAFDRPWVFGQRYMRHKFVSTDPFCPNCRNEVPHRTLLICPTCGRLEHAGERLTQVYRRLEKMEQIDVSVWQV